MQITFEQLGSFLSDQGASLSMLNDRRSLIRGVRLFGEATRLEPGLLYVGYGSKLNNDAFLERNVNLLCIGPIDGAISADKRVNANIIELPGELSLEDIFNRVQSLFESNEVRPGSLKMGGLENAFIGKGLQNTLDVGQAMLSNPIYLVHGEYALIAKSSRISVPDAICQELHKKGRLTVAEADTYFGKNFLERFRIFDKPTLIESTSLPYNRILGKVEVPDGDLAAVAVVEFSRPFHDQDYEIVGRLCAAIEQELSGESRARSINEAKVATLVSDLIDGLIQDEHHLGMRLESMSWAPPKSFKLFQINPAVVSDTYLTFYRDQFSKQLPHANVFIYRDSVVILHETPSDKCHEEALEEKLKFLCEINGLRCGASGEAKSLIELGSAFRQASRVLRATSRLQTPGYLFRHEDFLLPFLIERLSQNVSVDDYVHPIIRSIQEYDLAHGGDYSDTLYTYLIRGKDMVRASQDLFIHRNTLAYRLRRLSEMFDVDWDDGYLLAQLFVSLEITRFSAS